MLNTQVALHPTSFSYRIAILFISTIFLFGCVSNDTKRTTAEGCAAGAVIGGIIGNIVSGGDRAKGTLIGALIGGGIGCAVGDHVANKKAQFAKQEDYLSAVTAEAKKKAQEAKEYNSSLKREIAHLEDKKQQLNSRSLSTRTKNQEIAKQKQKTSELISLTKEAIASLNKEIEVQQQVVAREKTTAKPQYITVAVQNINELGIQQRALERSLIKLKNIDNRRAY